MFEPDGLINDIFYIYTYAALHMLRMQPTAKLLGSPDPLFSIPLKLICADHGLHPFWHGCSFLDSQYGLGGLDGFVPTLELGDEDDDA